MGRSTSVEVTKQFVSSSSGNVYGAHIHILQSSIAARKCLLFIIACYNHLYYSLKRFAEDHRQTIFPFLNFAYFGR